MHKNHIHAGKLLIRLQAIQEEARELQELASHLLTETSTLIQQVEHFKEDEEEE